MRGDSPPAGQDGRLAGHFWGCFSGSTETVRPAQGSLEAGRLEVLGGRSWQAPRRVRPAFRDICWMPFFKRTTLPHKAWEETAEQYRSRLRHCAAYINSHYDVHALCHDLPARLEELRHRRGDRLAH